jgi:hypothetical protein
MSPPAILVALEVKIQRYKMFGRPHLNQWLRMVVQTCILCREALMGESY